MDCGGTPLRAAELDNWDNCCHQRVRSNFYLGIRTSISRFSSVKMRMSSFVCTLHQYAAQVAMLLSTSTVTQVLSTSAPKPVPLEGYRGKR